MAAITWEKMKRSDSRECRNCHNFEYMDFTIQETRAASEHQSAIDNSMTCIDCHQGIAHNLPAGYQEEYQRVIERIAGTATEAPDRTAPISLTALRDYLGGTGD